MKKLYILIFSCLWLLGFSQTYSSLLQSVNWKIVKIQWNNVEYYPPSPVSNSGKLTFDSTQNRFWSSLYNSSSGICIFGNNNANYFSVQSVATSLGVYEGENTTAVQQFDEMTTGFYFGFPSTSNFTFDYEEVMSGKNLVVTNPDGNKIFYSNLILGTIETSKQKISVYPNPATDLVIIENLKPNSSIEVIDSSGKTVKSISDNKTSKTEINIKNLTSGIYYLKIDGQSIQKIIKK